MYIKTGKTKIRKIKMKKTEIKKRLFALFLSAVLVFSSVPFSVVSNAAAVYSSDYRYWSQGASDLEKMRKYGCWIVAQAKLLYETNVNREESFNPDVYYYWQRDNGFVDSGFYQTNGGLSPVSYSKEKGKPLEYLGYFTATEDKLWENINNGYYSILQLNNGGHYVYLDNETSKKKKKLYCFDSWSEQYSYGTRLLSNYKKWDVCYVYKPGDPNDLLRPSKPTLVSAGATCLAGSETTFGWSSVSGAEGYRLRILKESGAAFKSETLKDTTEAKYTLPKGKYTVILTAFNSYGDSPESSLEIEAVTGCTVTFDPNGGTCQTKKLTVTVGAEYGKLPRPKRTGYNFSGWYTAKTGGTRVSASTKVTNTANHTLYARWSHTHSYTSKVTTEATCQKKGVKTFTCVCGDSYTESIETTDHKYDAFTEKATLSSDGVFKVSCVYCQKTVYSSPIAKIAEPSLSATSYTYNGKEKTPSVTAFDSGSNPLYPGADYTVNYKNNVKPGKAAAEITFTGKYAGTKKLLFDIKPSIPKKLSAKQTAKAITVSWNKVEGAFGYRVSLFNRNKKLLKTVETQKTTFRFKELQSGTKYQISVCAFGKSEDGAVYGDESNLLLTATKPVAPQQLSVTAGNGRAKLSWKKSFGADGYTVYYSTNKNSGFKKLETKKRTCTVTGLRINTVYYFKVTANKNVDGKIVSSAFSKRLFARIV